MLPPLNRASFRIGIGLALVTQHPLLWLLAFVALYIGFYWPAMYVEELRLQSLFGAAYQEYMDRVPRLLPRPPRAGDWPGTEQPQQQPFSWPLERRNKELRTVVVMLALLVVQALKLL